MIIERQLTSTQYKYSIVNNSTHKGIANYTYGIFLRRLNVIDNGLIGRYSIRQTQWYLIFLRILPFVSMIPPYYFYINNKKVGRTKIRFMSPKKYLQIGNDIYEFYLHGNNYISIMKNNMQIALIKKEFYSENERYEYKIDYNKNIDIDFMLICCMFVDIIYFPNRFKYDYMKYEKTINIFNDKYIDRVKWRSDS